jgi:cytidylate kinase
MRKLVVAIDGYSGTGKSSTAKMVAKKLGYRYIDSGAMYRAVTYQLLTKNIALSNMDQVLSELNTLDINFQLNEEGNSEIVLNGNRIEKNIRTHEINENVSAVAAVSEVRSRLVKIQQSFGCEKNVVMDGRDIGTVVFPDAELKIFMTAEVRTRALRRKKEMDEAGMKVELSEVEANLMERDKKDTTRKDSPLVKAKDAVEVDTTYLTFEEQVNRIVSLAKALM